MTNSNPRLLLRDHTYYIRVAVPRPIQYLAKRKEYRYSLDTKDYYVALSKLRAESFKIDLYIEFMKRLNMEIKEGRIFLTDTEIDQVLVYRLRVIEDFIENNYKKIRDDECHYEDIGLLTQKAVDKANQNKDNITPDEIYKSPNDADFKQYAWCKVFYDYLDWVGSRPNTKLSTKRIVDEIVKKKANLLHPKKNAPTSQRINQTFDYIRTLGDIEEYTKIKIERLKNDKRTGTNNPRVRHLLEAMRAQKNQEIANALTTYTKWEDVFEDMIRPAKHSKSTSISTLTQKKKCLETIFELLDVQYVESINFDSIKAVNTLIYRVPKKWKERHPNKRLIEVLLPENVETTDPRVMSATNICKYLTIFQEFLKYCRKERLLNEDTLDRLQRGFGECEKIKELLKADKIEVRFIQEALILDKFSSEDDFTRYDFGILSAKLYLTSMNKNVKRSQKYNREAGLWQGLAPIGYLNAKDERRRATLILDPDRAPIIKQIFEEYASGVHSLKSVWLSATEKGLLSKEPNYNPKSKNYGKICPISKNKVYDILTNPFYYGVMYVADEEIDEKTKKPIKTFYKLVNHVYEPLISKELFDKVQKVLKNRKKEKFCKEQKYAGIPFVFRGLITCKCGCAITPEHHKKGNKEYIYLRCSHQKGTCNQKLVNENNILEQLDREIFHQIRISPTMQDLLKQSITASLEDEKKINASVRKKIAEQINIIDNRLERLWKCFLDQDINKAKYETEKQKYLEQKKELEARAEKYTDISNGLKENVEKAIDFVSNISDLMKKASPDEKNMLLKKLLTNCVLDGDVLKYEIQAPFDKLLSCTNYKKWKDIAMENLEEFEKIVNL